METLDYNPKHWDKPCPKHDCRKSSCKCGLEKVFFPAALGNDDKESSIAPKNGAYCNAIVVYEANGHIYIYSKEGVPTLITSGGGGDYDEIIREIQADLARTEDGLAQEILDRAAGDNTLQDEIDAIKSSPDVVDIVDTYADLQNYDTSGLTDKDVIRVIVDETKDGLSSYYRWNSPNPGWNFIGVIPTGDGIKELSAADYNYPTANPDRVALWLLDNGLYTAPAGVMVAASTTSYPWYSTSDKTILVGGSNTVKGIYTFLNGKVDVVTVQASDGTEADEYTLFRSNQVLQTTGQSTTDTMSQDAITDALDGKAENANFVGTDGQAAGMAGLVPAPATTDVDKFLKSDGTWDAAGGGGGIIELTSADYNWPTDNPSGVAIWTLGSGVYIAKQGVRLYKDSNSNLTSNASMVIMQHEGQYPSAILYEWSGVQGVQGGGIVLGYTNDSGTLVGNNAANYIVTVLSRPLVQTTGTSSANVMSQNAVTSMVFNDPSNRTQIQIGSGAAAAANAVSIGRNTNARQGGVAIGDAAGYGQLVANNYRTLIGYQAGQNPANNEKGSVALGAYSKTSATGEMNIGSTNTTYGYNNSNYRLLSGVYDGQSGHDAVTVNQINSVIDNLNSALSVNIPHIGA